MMVHLHEPLVPARGVPGVALHLHLGLQPGEPRRRARPALRPRPLRHPSSKHLLQLPRHPHHVVLGGVVLVAVLEDQQHVLLKLLAVPGERGGEGEEREGEEKEEKEEEEEEADLYSLESIFLLMVPRSIDFLMMSW